MKGRGALGSTVVQGGAVWSVPSPGKAPRLLSDAEDIGGSLGCKSRGLTPGAWAGYPPLWGPCNEKLQRAQELGKLRPGLGKEGKKKDWRGR